MKPAAHNSKPAAYNSRFPLMSGRAPVLPVLAVLSCCLFLSCCGAPGETETDAKAVPAETVTPAAGIPESSPSVPVIEVINETDAETEAETETETETVPADPEAPPEEGMVRSPVTNDWISAAQAGRRPVAVMYPTDRKAQPQYGLDRAEIFYEIMEEGSMSRQMAIMTDWDGLSRIGNIRSIRDYFVITSMEWDAILVHFGGPEIFVQDILTRSDVDNINGVGGIMGPDYGAFYRIPAGSRSEHTAYTDSEHLKKAIEKAGFPTEFREEYREAERWRFAPASRPADLSSLPECTEATEIDMSGCFPVTKSSFLYNAQDRLYYRSIYGEPQRDALTGNQMAFSNILIESCDWGERGAGYLYFHVLDEGHKGYFITGGKMIPCTWGKTSEYGVTRFYDLNGEEITLNTGKTMICIGRNCDSFRVNGTEFDL